VTSFLLPLAIDSAVANDLQRVLRVYEASRPYTFGAMDGAASKGRLDIVSRLHSTRSEGCSSAAFLGAAKGGYILVLRWLYEFYPEKALPPEEIVMAARCGHVPVVGFLLPFVRREHVEAALKAAAANGHVDVMDVLLTIHCSVGKSMLAAARNGHAQVVQYLLDRGYNDRYTYVNPALLAAAQGGHWSVLELLVDLSDAYTIGDALMTAAMNGREELVTFLLGRCRLEKSVVARALKNAAERDYCDLVKLLLDDFNREEAGSSLTAMRAATCFIDSAFIAALKDGRIGIVKLLVGHLTLPISYALGVASSSCQLEVLGFILDYCQAHDCKDTRFTEELTGAVEEAAHSRNIDVVKLLLAKCDALDTGSALRIAVGKDDVEMLRVLVVRSSLVSIGHAVVAAAVTNRVEMLEALLEHGTVDMIEQALIRVESLGHDVMSKLLLGKCEPAAYSRIFDNAARQGLVGLVQLLLDKMNGHSIRCALISAAINGHSEVVEILADESDSMGVTCAFEMAALRNHADVVKLLRSRCDPDSVRFVLSASDADVVQVLRNKRPRLD